MNLRPLPSLLRITTLLSLTLAAPLGQATDWQDRVLTPIEDPLLTRPPQLDLGVVLPGDEQVYQCLETPPPTADLSLTAAVSLALCHHPQIRNTRAAIALQAAQLGQARAAYLPRLTASISRLHQRTEYPNALFQSDSDLRSQSQYLSLSWRLLDFGGRDANRRAANAALEAALATHDATLQKVMNDVIGLYFDALTARATREARETTVALSRQTLALTVKKQGNGAAARTDALQAHTALSKAELELARASGAENKALVALKVALGLPGAAELRLASPSEEIDAPWQSTLQQWLAQVEQQHPAILAARAQLSAARERLTATRAEGLPSLDASLSRYRNGRPDQGLSSTDSRQMVTGVTLNIPLFDGFSHTYKVRGAQAQIAQREAELQETTDQVLGDVARAHADVMSAWTSLAASAQLLDSAQQAQAGVQSKFSHGAADLIDMLNVQNALADAQQERIRALADWRAARLRLFASAGMAGTRLLRP